jgi:hypothetical protein
MDNLTENNLTENNLTEDLPSTKLPAPPRPKWLLKANYISLAGKEVGMLFAVIALILKLFFSHKFTFDINDVIKLCLFLAGAGVGIDLSKIAAAMRDHK